MISIRKDIRYHGVISAIRFKLVRVIEQIRPYRYCHAWLIVWALGHASWNEICEQDGHVCRKDSDSDRMKDSGCYCGYYWNGKLNR